VFVEFTNGAPSALETINPNGSHRETILSSDIQEMDFPSWSPDGTKIVFNRIAADGTSSNLFMVNADGKNLTKITRSSHSNEDAAWSPNGTRLVFASNRSGNFDLWIKDLQTGRLRRLTTDPAQVLAPDWSPDGTRIAFTSRRSGNLDVWVKDLRTNRARQITRDTADDGWPTWSPDGSHIAFMSARTGNSDIFVVAQTGPT